MVAAETVKTAGDKEPEVTPGSPGAAEEEDPKAEIKGTKRPAEVSIPPPPSCVPNRSHPTELPRNYISQQNY